MGIRYSDTAPLEWQELLAVEVSTLKVNITLTAKFYKCDINNMAGFTILHINNLDNHHAFSLQLLINSPLHLEYSKIDFPFSKQ